MPTNYDFKSAKTLVEIYKEKLNTINETKIISENNSVELYMMVSNLVIKKYFSKYIDTFLKQGTLLDDEYITKLKLLIYKSSSSFYIKNECDKLGTNFLVDINRAIGKINICNNPLKWLFANKLRKQNAEDAYNTLLNYNNSYIINKIDEIKKVINSIDKSNEQIAITEFSNNKKKMLEILDNEYDKVFSTDGLVDLFKKIVDDYNKINEKINYFDKVNNELKMNIEKEVNKYLAQELVNSLRLISIDELSRDRNGLRIKCLRDAGYETLADVFSASIYELSSIYGISKDMAYTIDKICNDYAINIKKQLKIKLSYDNQTRTTTSLVKNIYKYLNFKIYMAQYNNLHHEFGEKLEQSINLLESVKNGFKCLFMDTDELQEIKNSFVYAKKIFYLDYKEKIENIYKLINKNENNIIKELVWDDFSKNSIKYYNVLEELFPGLLGNEDSIYGLPKELARAIQDECFFPDGLLCTLRRYQEWGVKYILHQEKVLLGDEMGLGKTIQAIATMVSLKNTGATHFLVVCPASVVTNWCREVIKHSKLKVTKIHGKGKTQAFNSWLRTGGVAVTNFESTSIIKLAEDFKYAMLIVDEAHYIKNSSAIRTINTVNISKKTKRLLFMTGTALENNVDEMISLVNVLRPQVAFEVSKFAFMSTSPQFREKIAPVYYRRKREDVLTELPDKIESEEWCTLNLLEEQIYEDAILEKRYNDARRVSWNVDDLNKSSKAQRLKEIVEEARLEGRKVLVFSFFLDTIDKIHNFLRGKCLNPINGSVNVNRRQEIIDEFENSPAGTVLLAQINSGGTGLNIQSASVVVICEPQFKPSIENQAISRAYRMGQSRNVLVYRLLCEDSIDEKLINILKEKQNIFNAFADKSVAAEQTLEVDDKKFGEIINEEIDRINKKRGISNYKKDVEKKNNSDLPVDEKNNIDEEALKINIKVDIDRYNLLNSYKGLEYYNSIMKLSYYELVSYLLYKYGPAKYDYFATETCSTRNKKTSRTNEGLICHHIDEDKAIMLCDDKYAINNPYRYQKADRLVYCNFLEHLLLHILIFEEPKNKNANKLEIQGIGGAVSFICKQINDYYGGYQFKMQWLINTTAIIKDDYESYVSLLNRLWKSIKEKHFDVFISKEQLAMGWDGTIYKSILKEIK